MSKLKSPILSLGARGTIADALTYQHRNQGTIVRTKPIPAYRRTLPQVYQRWLYEDYAYLWTQQTEIIKRQYAADGSRFHLTGFQYWMKYQLTNLPDIAGWWKLDDNLGATTIDSSRNNNTGTIFGASPATGLIGQCLSFDGINDYIRISNSPSLKITSAITLEALVYLDPDAITDLIANKREDYSIRYAYGNRFMGHLYIDGAWRAVQYFTPTSVWTHFAITYDSAPGRRLITPYLDGTPGTPNQLSGLADYNIRTSNYDFYIATSTWVAGFLHGLVDNVILSNRELDATEIKRHSERRYP